MTSDPIAVLGPTNTGKTHLAVERMIAHPSGMIGLPLRLLAREIYERVKERCGAPAVALITGEEKIIPKSPRYWVCTVEAMPSNLDVSFLGIDEIQLANDLERGHVFTDRLLHCRGRSETMLLGAQTMRPTIAALLPRTTFISRPRLSNLTYAGHKKLTRLPRRSAIVAFSADMVYAVAELVRRQRGGAAVVMGGLSPRTRNAQVALYQSGEVDFLVATDAIGMGLNMDVDHVAFAATRKFDGMQFRPLNSAEMGQIAGRAGRHINDGTFGVTADAAIPDPEMIERLEDHNFEPVRVLQWRNRNLNFNSLSALKASLLALPNKQGLTRARPGADVTALETLSRDEKIRAIADNPARTAKLWQVCQIPDYRNISNAEHSGICGRIFHDLNGPKGRVDPDWFNRQLSYCERMDGELDTLSNRIAHIRTWTFVANRPDWLEDQIHWQERAHDIENKLSDALHDRLTQRFIDRRTSILLKRMRQKEQFMSSVDHEGSIFVEGEYVGQMKGLRFVPDGLNNEDGKPVRAAAQQAVSQEVIARAGALVATPDTELSLTAKGEIIWQNAPVGRLKLGAAVLKPNIDIVAQEQLTGPERDGVQMRLEKFIARHIGAVLEPLIKLQDDEDITGLTRGIVFQLIENFGIIEREPVAANLKELAQEERGKLRKYGVRFGAFHIFIPVLLKPAATELRLLLWALQLVAKDGFDLTNLPQIPGQGLTSTLFDSTTPRGFYRIVGFCICGVRVVRIDMLERLADLIRVRVFWRPQREGEERPAGSVEGGGFSIIPDMMSLVGCSGEEFAGILKSLGFNVQNRSIEPQAPKIVEIDAAPIIAESEDISEAPVTPVEAVARVVASDADQEPLEPQILQVWWPKDTGPFRNTHRHNKPDRQRTANKSTNKTKFSGKNNKSHATSSKPTRKPPRRVKPMDKDSPFAVLSALKDEMSKKKN